MRHYFFLLFTSLLLLSCRSPSYKGTNGITYRSARQYNDFIISRQVKLFEHMASFGKTLDSGWEPSTRQLQAAAQENRQLILEVQGMPAFNKDSTFRDAAVLLLQFYQQLFDRDYPQLFETMQQPGITESEIDKATSDLGARVATEEKQLNLQLQQAQRNFAKANQLELVNNSSQEKLEKAFREQ